MASRHRSQSEDYQASNSQNNIFIFERVERVELQADVVQVKADQHSRNVFLNKAEGPSISQLNSVKTEHGSRRASSPARITQSSRPLLPPATEDEIATEDASPSEQSEPPVGGSRELYTDSWAASSRRVWDVTDNESQKTDEESDQEQEQAGSSSSAADSEAEEMNSKSKDPSAAVKKSHETVERKEEIEATHDIKNLEVGDVFTVLDAAAQITSRTFIVMAHTAEGTIQCLSLCRHGGLKPKPGSLFLSYHCKVYDALTESEATDQPEEKRRVMIRFANEQTTRLKDGCWTNCQQVFTVFEVGFRRDGEVEQFPEFLNQFVKIQKRMYEKAKPNE